MSHKSELQSDHIILHQGRVKSTGKTDLGLLQITAFNANKELNKFGIIFPIAYITGILKVLYICVVSF